ncbi:MAG: NADPH:quinone reductase [Tepidisphaeraceae bacterium]
MQSIRVHAFGDPDVLKLEEIPAPTAGPGQVLVAIKAIGVNPVDTYIRAGKYGPRPFPYTPGFDAAGTIESVGPPLSPPLAAGNAPPPQATGYMDAAGDKGGPSSFQPGDRVYLSRAASGSYAQKAIVDLHNVYPLPEHISFAQGAAIGVPYGTAHRALFQRGQVKTGETVFVHGATGGVGLATVQIARAFGCTVIGSGGSDEGRKLALREGAHHVLDHHDADYLKTLMDLTAGRGVDLILEMLANVNLGKDLTVLARHGRVIVIGSRGPVEIDPRDTMSREADIRGVMLPSATPQELIAMHAQLRVGLENGTLRPIIDHELPLSQAAKAHVEVLQGHSRGKIVLVPSPMPIP